MAQSVILIASVGFLGDPVIPLVREKSSHVPPAIVSVGPLWNCKIPSDMMPSSSGRETFIPRLSHWINFSMVVLFLTANGTA